MSLNIAKKVAGLTAGIGLIVPTSWGIYNLTSTTTNEVPEETRTLKNFKKISKGEYKKGSLAGYYFEEGEDKYYLGTGKENKKAWEEMFKYLKEQNWLKGQLSQIDDLDNWVTTSFNGVDKGFDEKKGEKSLNGLCEKIYNNEEFKESLDSAAWYLCSPPVEEGQSQE